MELEDLKKAWQQSGDELKTPHRDVNEIIKRESLQPLAQLKRRFRKGIMLMPAIAAIVVIEFSHKRSLGARFLAWYLLSFCLLMLVYFYVNYHLVKKMEASEGDVHTNLILQAKSLKKLLRLRLLLMRGAIALFFISLELIMYLNDGRGYTSWYAHDIVYRFSVYIAVFVLFFFFTRFTINHRYRQYIERLELLLNEFESPD